MLINVQLFNLQIPIVHCNSIKNFYAPADIYNSKARPKLINSPFQHAEQAFQWACLL